MKKYLLPYRFVFYVVCSVLNVSDHKTKFDIRQVKLYKVRMMFSFNKEKAIKRATHTYFYFIDCFIDCSFMIVLFILLFLCVLLQTLMLQ